MLIIAQALTRKICNNTNLWLVKVTIPKITLCRRLLRTGNAAEVRTRAMGRLNWVDKQ